MLTRQKPKNNFSAVFLALIFILSIYFIYHSYNGELGLKAYGKQEQEVAQLRVKLSELMAAKAILVRKVAFLRNISVSKDILDEYIRRNLNSAYASEFVILK